jgi:hypothetical protein
MLLSYTMQLSVRSIVLKCTGTALTIPEAHLVLSFGFAAGTMQVLERAVFNCTCASLTGAVMCET